MSKELIKMHEQIVRGHYKLNRDAYPDVLIKPEGTWINDEMITPQSIKITSVIDGIDCIDLEELIDAYIELKRGTRYENG